MEVDGRGAGGDHGLIPRSAGHMERGNDNQPGTETTTADGDRISAGGWEQPSGADGSTDSLAFWHDNELERKADCPWRMPAEDTSRSGFPDSQNGAPADLCRNRHGAESCWPSQCLWPPFYESARRIYLPQGRL